MEKLRKAKKVIGVIQRFDGRRDGDSSPMDEASKASSKAQSPWHSPRTPQARICFSVRRWGLDPDVEPTQPRIITDGGLLYMPMTACSGLSIVMGSPDGRLEIVRAPVSRSTQDSSSQ
jgi:hypothetical protein